LGAHPLYFEEWSSRGRPLDGLHLPIADDDPLDHNPTKLLEPN